MIIYINIIIKIEYDKIVYSKKKNFSLKIYQLLNEIVSAYVAKSFRCFIKKERYFILNAPKVGNLIKNVLTLVFSNLKFENLNFVHKIL